MRGLGKGFGKKGIMLLIAIVGVLSFVGGVMAANIPQSLSSVFQKSDMEWARETGYISISAKEEGQVSQSEFLKMVMTRFGDTKAYSGYLMPKVKGHWAEGLYSAGKANGVISCSCQIKPDHPLTLKEASDFVMRAINKKAGQQVIGLLDVEAWAKRVDDNSTRNVTFREAAMLIREMDSQLKMIEKENNSGVRGDEKKIGK